LRGGVHRYAAQASALIDTARAEKNRFRMKTNEQPDYRACNYHPEPDCSLFYIIFAPAGQKGKAPTDA